MLQTFSEPVIPYSNVKTGFFVQSFLVKQIDRDGEHGLAGYFVYLLPSLWHTQVASHKT